MELARTHLSLALADEDLSSLATEVVLESGFAQIRNKLTALLTFCFN